ncbi:hypothetical protein A2U01_0114794, partial [Trifolium medium]|nr:hypothetical protein [Trifolium medium]
MSVDVIDDASSWLGLDASSWLGLDAYLDNG